MQDISAGMEMTINYILNSTGVQLFIVVWGCKLLYFFGCQVSTISVWLSYCRYKVEPSNRLLKNYKAVFGSTTKKSQRIPKWKKTRPIPKRKVKTSSRKQVIKGSTRRSYQIRGAKK